MTDFKGRHFSSQIILWAVRWYCKYGMSYRELAEMLEERGIHVNHSTIYRWMYLYLSSTRNTKTAQRFWNKALRSVKPYNRIESDHGKLKRLINVVRGFQSKRTAGEVCLIENRKPMSFRTSL